MKQTIPTISPADLMKLQASTEIEVIDVRTPAEFQAEHATVVSSNQPLHSLDPQYFMSLRNSSVGAPLYVICRTGNRSHQACEQFVAAGFDNVVNVAGGTVAWQAAGLPLNRGREVMSLERQVRIAAGSLVLLGALLAWFYHPAFVFLSAFVGTGLIFSGVTDTCGMAMALARMPWNQLNPAACSNEEI